MSKALIVCRKCGREVPDGRFCKFCGNPLETEEHIAVEDTGSDLVTDLKTDETSMDETHEVSLPEFDIEVDGMDHRSLASILSRSELDVLQSDLDSIIEQTQAIRQALNLDHADKALLKSRAEDLKIHFDATKIRRAELSDFDSKLKMEESSERLAREQTRLEKLEEIKPSLDSEVYKEQREEILVSMKAFRHELEALVKTGKAWRKALAKKRKEIERNLNRLEAKHKIGDISDSHYESSKRHIERSIRILDGGFRILEEVIESAEQTLKA
ncbi:MAG: hypothetical protein BAJATHORv1_50028 [Candidatus Thorarchaeota archaeon]|nr:MAG: hypothetical protein BAJATHORv1_50028 [Candidatus Thorarchaeota archaeon]